MCVYTQLRYSAYLGGLLYWSRLSENKHHIMQLNTTKELNNNYLYSSKEISNFPQSYMNRLFKKSYLRFIF